MKLQVAAICAGAASTLPSGKSSGIHKQPLEGPVMIGVRGIETDEQVDRKHHGYPAMALHHFPQEHYDWLRYHFGQLNRLGGAGSMGENIATTGLTEHDVHIGDRFRLGSALIEVTQPRQPCSTIEQHLEAKGMVKAIVSAARPGWFYRVLEPGMAQAGDHLERVETGDMRWSVARAFLSVYGANRAPDAELEQLAAVPRVSDRLVLDIRKRLSR
ncbi:MOSC domain-containing protein YiiM [Altererythrobacter xiamenensis]|uniref:MOSC domain-containing protein YiiM n=2 Tax=Altererythrobacter xiamenensis TaxID=1316679 RepID=A0A1Y6E5L0_9SPHN|nr:MOSC domain-containing protein YiiM [Altererythrobacter xiamenensis]